MKLMALMTLFLTLYSNSSLSSTDSKTSSPPQSQQYLLISHHPHFLEQIKQYTNTTKKNGRIILVSLKAEYQGEQSSSIPIALRKFLRKIDPATITQYISTKSPNFKSSPKLRQITKTISPSDIKPIVEKLSSFRNRAGGTSDNMQAVEWVKEQFNSLNLETTSDCFRAQMCNIYATYTGASKPEELVIIAAHIDSIGRSYAGADDNASGVAGLLVLAKKIVTQASHPERSIIFFVTNGEERGLLGAKHYVRQLASKGQIKNIKFSINMDMIGYNKNRVIDLETNREFESLAQWMADLTKLYTTLTPNITIPAWGSDHVPFLDRGVPTILSIEHWKTKTPCYHASCDKPETINYEYASEILKLNLAAILSKAQSASAGISAPH